MAIVETILGSVLASVFQVLFDKLASLGLDYAQRKETPPFGISTDLLVKWKKMLDTIYAVLDDAEDKQQSSKGPEKLWLDDVRDLAYDMEDLLDEFAIEAAKIKSSTKSSTSRGWMNRKFSWFGRDKSYGSSQNPHLHIPQTKVQEINDRLELIVIRKDSLRLTENAMNRCNYTDKRLPSTSLSEPQFFGRDKEEAKIVELLTSEAKYDNTMLQVVPIVGMGGVGKTALAQQLYNDTIVSNYFKRKAWVCVSDNFDVLNITKTILQSIYPQSSCKDKDLNELQVELKKNLSMKKFLVVLDDVWNEDYEKWTTLLKPLEAGAKGSKIIVTTRNHSAIFEKGDSTYHLNALPPDNCMSLLAFHALGTTTFEGHSNLETIGEEIVEKCKGLPLAVKMLGGALCNERNPDKWKDILNNRIWDLPKGKKDGVLPVLKLSYLHLSSYLKRCFAYCAVFPKDYEIERDELVLLWIAEGFLDGQKTKDVLSLGRDHFDELVSRSFFQQSRVNACKFSMHDLLNDLAKSIAGGTCFSSGESQVAGNADDASLEKARYASFISSGYVTSEVMRAFHRMKVLRSLMILNIKDDRTIFISNNVLHDLLTKLKHLRVLWLCHCSIKDVPNCVGDLKHLRYLNFSYTIIQRLPDSIDGLCKLQALILRGCRKLSMLPPSITKLVSLQFLDLRDTPCLKKMPLGIGNLKNLTILSKFVVGPKEGPQLKELNDLSHLQGELFLLELQKVEEVRDAVRADLFGKQGLSSLFLHWDEHFGNLWNDKHESQVLLYLRPHTNLESLTISHYSGAIFPPWLDGPSYSKIVRLCLRGCPNVTLLPSLGQLPSLRELSLEGLHVIRIIGSEFYGDKRPFPSLSTLKFKEMSAWRDWSHYVGGLEEVPFSCLRHLVVQSCPSLFGTLPCQLDHLMKLEIHSCRHLNNSTNKVCLPSLRELYLVDCSKEILRSLVNLTSLSILNIHSFEELVCFDHGFMSSLIKLKELHIGGCDKLNYLWQEGNEMQNLMCLQSITMYRCPQFTSFMAEEGERELPCNLESMILLYCTSLEKLPSKMHTLRNLIIWGCPKLTIPLYDPINNNPASHLESPWISKCDSLTSFPFAEGRLAALKKLDIRECKGVKSLEEIPIESLNSLSIFECENLGSLPQCLHTLSHLTQLQIIACPALEMDFLPLPVTLSSLRLEGCPQMKSIASYNIASCSNLTELTISVCQALEIVDFPPLPITLSELSLDICPKIKSLPSQWQQFTSLRRLIICDCENIECFPKGGLPPNLQQFLIEGCNNMKQPVREWGLFLLTSLEILQIDGRSMGGEGDKVWFPSEDDKEGAWSLLFPSSLTDLHLGYLKNVERLSSGLRNYLSSLRWLMINNCWKLRDLPEDGFPPSLQQLRILRCENLKDRYSKLTGDHWPLIQEIPYITIDSEHIQ